MGDDWYKKRRTEGLCISCGRLLDRGDKRLKCPACRKKQKEKEDEKYGRISGFHANEKLDADAMEAQKAGMTYGQWKMKQYMEQLKGKG